MKSSMFTPLKSALSKVNQWLYGTPERALDQAYQAALKIKSIEDEHFGGKKISTESENYGNSLISYFQTELNQNLNTAKVRLAEFNASRAMMNASQSSFVNSSDMVDGFNPSYLADSKEKQSIIIEKLNFIDRILEKYSPKKVKNSSLIVVPQPKVVKLEPNGLVTQPILGESNTSPDTDTISDKTGILPRSILGTINRIQRDLDPRSEDEVVRKFRKTKKRTLISIKFILTLILVPLLTQQLTKNFVIGPIVDRVREEKSTEIFINFDLEEEALIELERFEKQLEFKSLIGLAPPISPAEKEERVKEKAVEIAEDYRDRSGNAIKNIIADLLSLFAFAWVITTNRKEIIVLKSFIDDVVYGLSDSAKAFIIILFTDIFVGFHSPHGWEVILEGVSRHLGLPENRDFIFLFIATFPVILDTMFKYWIFRYLNRISPSAVATYRNMNE